MTSAIRPLLLSLLLTPGVLAQPWNEDSERLNPTNAWPVYVRQQDTQWMIGPLGMMYSDEENNFDQGNVLSVNGEMRLSGGQVRVSANRDQLAIGPMNLNREIVITRRMFVDDELPWLILAEVVQNDAPDERTVTLSVTHDLGGQIVGHWSTLPEGDAPAKPGEPIIAGINQGAGRMALAVIFGTARAPHVAAIDLAEGSDRVTYTYQDVPVPPGEAVVLLHAMRLMPEVAADDLTISAAELLNMLPEPLRRRVVNFRSAGWEIAGRTIPRGESTDILELSDGSQLRGELTLRELNATTPFGQTQVAPAELAAVLTEPGERFTIVTRAGEAFVAELASRQFGFTLSSGQQIELTLDRVRAIGTRAEGTSPDRWQTPGGFIELADGQRLQGELADTALAWSTSAGPINVPWSAVSELRNSPAALPWLVLLDGSELPGVPLDDAATLRTQRFGTRQVPLAELTRVAPPAASTQPATQPSPAVGREEKRPLPQLPPTDTALQIKLTGQGQLRGQVPAGRARVLTEIGAIDVPLAQTQRIAFTEDGRATVTWWDGSSVAGRLEPDPLPIRLGCGVELAVPTARLGELVNQRVELPAALVARARDLLVQLDAREPQARDTAQAELLKLGRAVVPVLVENDRLSAEQRERVDRLLEKLGIIEATQALPAPKSPDMAEPFGRW